MPDDGKVGSRVTSVHTDQLSIPQFRITVPLALVAEQVVAQLLHLGRGPRFHYLGKVFYDVTVSSPCMCAGLADRPLAHRTRA